MRIFKRLKKVSYLAVLIICNLLVSFFVEPADSASGRMWEGYYKEDNLDTIFVGSSVCQQTFIPGIFNQELGMNAYNMGTPSQAVPQTFQAIEVAVKEHDIKTVIYGMGYFSFKYLPIPQAELTFESARVREKGGIEGMLETLEYVYSDEVRAEQKSINFLFPWVFNYEDLSMNTLLNNAVAKGKELIEDMTDGSAPEEEKMGYRNDDTSVLDYEKKWEVTSAEYGATFETDMLEELENLMAYCKMQEIDLIILNTPHPVHDVVACHGFYKDNEAEIKRLVAKYDADYYDFSLVREEFFDIEEEFFADYEHLNAQGSEAFCKVLAKFLEIRAAGEAVDKFFYEIDEFYDKHSDLILEYENGRYI